MRRYRYLIIGNSAAGIGAAEGIREVDDRGSIGIIADEPQHTHSRALIAFWLMGRITAAGMDFRPRDFYDRFGIDPLLGRRVRQVDFAGRQVLLHDGEEVGYAQLLLATGGQPLRPPIPGVDLGGVFNFQSLADAAQVQAALSACRRAVVIGGGLIGMQAAEALCELGHAVTVVELLPRILAPVFDDAAAGFIAGLFEQRGVQIRTGTAAAAILPRADDPARVGGVRLPSGEEIAADLVILSVGVVPRVELAHNSPLAVDKGIVVDQRGATSLAGVYAAGDCAAGRDLITGQVRPLPIWPRAYAGGRLAGLNMAGRQVESADDLAMNSSHFFGFPAMSAGIHDPDGPGLPPADYEVVAESRTAEGYYKKVVLQDDRIVGLVLLGEAVDRAGILVGLMKEAVRITTFKDRILQHTALSSLPDVLRHSRLHGR